MASPANDVNLRIALTMLQYIALALPAIYIFLQLVDTMEDSPSIDELNKYHIARSGVMWFVIAAALLILSIGSNLQHFPFNRVFGQSTEGWILTIALGATMLGTIQFGFSVFVRLFRVERGGTTVWKSYKRTFADIWERFRRWVTD